MGQLIKLMQEESTIRFLISYMPTILFLLIIVLGILKGIIRGFKKTSIYLIHSIVCASICLILFFVLVNVKEVDSWLLSVTNSFLGSPNLQQLLGVSENSNSFREIFIEYIPKQMTFFDGLSLILENNGAYLSTLVDVAYRLVFGLALFILYLIMRLFAYIFYNVFFLQRRYMNKQLYLYGNGYIDYPVSKRRTLGGILGGSVGVLKGIIMLSFFGTFFFIFAGGIGDKKTEEVHLKQNEYNLIYGAYSEIGSYGSQGIYKILNSVRDEKNMPYYLFITNMIFKGNIDDSIQNIKGNVYLADELAKYVGFSRDTLNLFIKYDKQNIVKFVNQEDEIVILDEIIKVFQNKKFQDEFRVLIEQFEAKTYFINLTLSLVNTIASNLEEMSFSKDIANTDLVPLRILFEKGYFCDDIPSEKALKDENSTEILPYITASKLLTKDDFYLVYDIFLNFINNFYNYTMESDNIIEMIKASTDELKNLSILSSARRNELDPVFIRVYKFFEYKYLGGSSDILNNTIPIEKLNVSWTEELSALMDYCNYGLDIYLATKLEDGSVDLMAMINELFKDSRKSDLKKLIDGLQASKLIGYILSASSIFEGFGLGLNDISYGATMPLDVSFVNVYDDYGNFIEYGELYYLLKTISLLSDNLKAKEAFLSILSGNQITNINNKNNMMSSYDNSDPNIVSNLLDSLGESEIVLNTIVSSKIFSSIISNYLINSIDESSSFNIYIDDSIRVIQNDEMTNIIDNTEIKKLFSNSKFLSNIFKKVEEVNSNKISESDLYEYYIDLLFKNDNNLFNALDSKIIEGTVSNYLFNQSAFYNETIHIPSKYMLKNATTDEEINEIKSLYISTEYRPSEIKRFINVIKNVNLEILTGKDELLKVEYIKNLDKDSIDLIFSSDIAYYSISDLVKDMNFELDDYNLRIIVPDCILESEFNSNQKVISKKELKNFILSFKEIDISGNDNQINKLIISVVNHKDILSNIIMNATLSKYLYDNIFTDSPNTNKIISVNLNKKPYQSMENPESFSTNNIWYYETQALFDSLDALLDISNNNNFSLNENDIVNKIKEDIFTYNDKIKGEDITKLDRISKSNIILSKITEEIDNQLDSVTDSINVKSNTRDLAKGTNGNYKKEELEALINIINYYWNSGVDNNYIRRTLKKSIDQTILFEYMVYHITNRFNKYLDYTNYTDENNKKITLLQLIFDSSITKQLFSEKLDSLNLFDSNSALLIKDSYGFIKEAEAKSMIELMDLFDIEPEDLDKEDDAIISKLTAMNINNKPNYLKLLDYKNNETYLDYFYNNYILSLVLYDAFSEALKDNNGKFIIPTEAKILVDGRACDAIEYEEALGMLTGASILDFESNEIEFKEIISPYVSDNLAKERIDIISKSSIFSSFFTNIILDSNYIEDIPSKAMVKDSRYQIEYISQDEIKVLLLFINKYKILDIQELNSILSSNDSSITFSKDGNVDDKIFSAYDIVESIILSNAFYNPIVNFIMLDSLKPDILNSIDKHNELKNALKAIELLDLIDSNGNIVDINIQEDENDYGVQIGAIIENIDDIYASYIVSSLISSILVTKDEFLTDTLVYEQRNKRLKKEEFKVLLSIDFSEPNLEMFKNNLNSGIIRYQTTKYLLKENPMFEPYLVYQKGYGKNDKFQVATEKSLKTVLDRIREEE